MARRTWNATYAGIIPDGVQEQALSQWYDVNRIAHQAQEGRTTFLVAVDAHDRVIGYAKASHRKAAGDAELFSIYVLPEQHGAGAGSKLLAAALDHLRQRGPVQRLFVAVERANQIGRAFYDRLGFLPVREFEEEMFDHRSPMLEMCLNVPPGP